MGTKPGSPTRGRLADADLLNRLSAHWDFQCAVERLTQLENDEALARRLQEQVSTGSIGTIHIPTGIQSFQLFFIVCC